MNPFIGVTDLRAFLETDQDPNFAPNALLVAIALDSACTAVRTYLQQNVALVEGDVAVLDGTGTDTLRLPERPIRALTGVVMDDEDVDADDYFLRGSRLVRKDRCIWWPGRGNIAVTYDHGWDVINFPGARLVPSDIRMVALLAARRVYEGAGEDVGDEASETIGAYSYSLDAPAAARLAGLFDEEKRMLSPYKFRMVA